MNTLSISTVVLLSLVTTSRAEELPRDERGHIPPAPDRSWHPVISLGGGVAGFIADGARDAIGSGTAWNVRAAFGNTSEIRMELVYSGSAQRVTAVPDAWLIGHGVVGLLRVNVTPKRVFEGFFYIGGGWSRFHVTSAETGLVSPDHVLEIPFGLGIARRYDRFVFDMRAGISILSGANLIPLMDPTTSASGETMHRYGLRANIGFEL